MRAYPAGLADDTSPRGSDADLQGWENWEPQDKAENDALVDGMSVPCKGSES